MSELCDFGRRARPSYAPCAATPAQVRHRLGFTSDDGLYALPGGDLRFCDRHMAAMIVAGFVDAPAFDLALRQWVDRLEAAALDPLEFQRLLTADLDEL